MNYSEAELQYIGTALWSSSDGDRENLDEFSIEDFDPQSLAELLKDFNDFETEVLNLGILEDYDSTDLAHDFWLTRNRHGAGFWDGDWPKEIGEKLTEMSQSYGEVNLYVGDDGKIYKL